MRTYRTIRNRMFLAIAILGMLPFLFLRFGPYLIWFFFCGCVGFVIGKLYRYFLRG